MTLRARPVARRRGRAGWDSGDRRNSLINLGFFIAIGLAVLILVGYTAWSWYDDHFGAAATVNGKVITKDDLRGRLVIENFRLDYIESRIQTLMAKGQISPSDGQQQIQFLAQRRQQLANLTLERLVDNALMGTLADQNGITVSDADIDDQLHQEATTSEQRHVYMIEIEPSADPITGEVDEAQKRAALDRAQRAIARLKAGESWEDVARTASDSGLAPQAGNLGWLSKDSGYDEAFMAAVFAAPVNTPTEIVEGEDGAYRIGRYTESTPEELDPTFQSRIEKDGILLADYRTAARNDVIRKKLSDKIVADLSKPSKQRHVLEIYLPEPNTSSTPGDVGAKVRWIVFSPKDDIANADELPLTDPAWVEAKAEADAAYSALRADISRFDAMARTDSDEGSAVGTGGKQPWIYPTSAIDEVIRSIVLEPTRKPDELIAPVKGELGWYVIQYLRPSGDGETAYLNQLKADVGDDASFMRVAKNTSQGSEARDGGDLGWIATGQLADELDKAVFSTNVGSLSSVVTIPSDGDYLLRVIGEETREATAEQLKIFKDSGFSFWYTRQKEAADIVYNLGSSSGTA
ncbi:MAG TPA: peptidylprolyl isomerase [Candidatus Limnocylindrales bacterium]|jgi:parvulin-like peptidyl-prolyl isomerase